VHPEVSFQVMNDDEPLRYLIDAAPQPIVA